MTRPTDHAMKAAESIANYCSTRFPTDNPPCRMIDVPWFAEKVQAAIDASNASLTAENECLRLYEKTHKQLRWYLGARGVNEEEAAVASQSVLREFEAAEAKRREQILAQSQAVGVEGHPPNPPDPTE